MQTRGTHSLLGRYAIYFRSFSDTLTRRQKQALNERREEQQNQASSSPEINAKHKSKGNDPVKDLERLKDAVTTSLPTIIKAKAVFPFDLFPDTISIDRKKVTVVHRTFFFMQQTISVQLQDIKNVEANLGPFFGSLIMTSQHFKNNVQHINFLKRSEVVEVQHILQGIIAAVNEKIDIASIDISKLRTMLKELGEGDVKEQPHPL